MASITTRKNGSRFITFHDAAGNPRHITLGQVAKRYAEAFKVRVEDLAAAALHGHSPTDDTSRWLSSLEDRLYAKLASVGLVPERQSATIGTLVERYIAERKDDLKPESTRKLRQTETKLLAFFDKDKSLRKITAEDATAWRRSLKDLGLSEAAIRTHCGNVKTMLGEAKRRKVIDANPFDSLRSGPTPSKYTRYITPDEIQRVLDACPDAEWRLLFGLARYAGLRIPSESHRLTWADVDFERARLTVHSPKTERWEGHDQRVVPITPKLMALLRDRFETMPEGETPLVTIGGKGAVIRRVRRIWAKASVEPWARLWQTLRSSCEKEWAMTFPQFAVSRWIGHSITISGKHYANAVPDELFERAAKSSAACAQRQAQRKASDGAGNEQKQGNDADRAEARNSADFRDLRLVSASPGVSEEWSRGEAIPPGLGERTLLDVTEQYVEVSDLSIEVGSPPAGQRFAYLCVFNAGAWRPVHHALVRDGVARFTAMGRDILYLPAWHAPDGVVAAGAPFILTGDGTREVLAPSLERQPLLLDMDGAARGDTRELDVWASSSGEWTAIELPSPTAGEPSITVDVPAGGLFWLHDPQGRGLERPFTVVNGRMRRW